METTTTTTTPVSNSVLDAVLTAQLCVAWAGETGDPARLKWWRTDLISEFGGEDLFKRLLPHTWRWAMFEAAREAARRRDTEMRAADADADRLVTLFRLGFEIDEHVDERLADHKRSGAHPLDALPALRGLVDQTWSKESFSEWVVGHGDAPVTTVPAGRRLKGDVPTSTELTVKKLVAALHPLADAYPLPHFRKAG